MKILAIEFSSPQRSVALVQGDGTSSPQSREVIETGAEATHALEMVEETLRQSGIEREEVDCLAIGLGPGSYTGIRAAIALAQGWQLARGTRLLGVSSADCVAAQAQEEGLGGQVGVVIDAQRGEFYLAGYRLDTRPCREVHLLRLATLAEVQQCTQTGAVLIGPEVTRWFPAGRIVVPRAAVLGRLALGRLDFVDGEKLEPIYLRETAFVKAPPPRIIP